MIEIASIVLAGFSVVSALLLLSAWLIALDFPTHTPQSVAVTTALMSAFVIIGLAHIHWLQGGPAPLELLHYRLCLFAAPALFYLFCRSAIVPEAPIHAAQALHLAPMLIALFAPIELGLPALLLIGVGYSLWFARLLWTIRQERPRADLQLAFFVVSSAMAIAVLAVGFALPWIDHAWFYLVYNASTGLAFAFIVFAVVAIPELFRDLSEIVRARTTPTSLGKLDVGALLESLELAMGDGELYRDETLGLPALADHLGISTHQLSELLNRHHGKSFSRFLREHRVAAAQKRLLAEPRASVLAIGLDVGFRSQSTFYSAFKEITGQSPGDWRKRNLD